MDLLGKKGERKVRGHFYGLDWGGELIGMGLVG